MPIQRLNPDTLPKLAGIHHVVKAGNTAYIAGEIAMDKDNNIIGKGDPEAQVEQIYKNLELACNAVGGTLANMVKTTTWITSSDYFPVISRAREKHYGPNMPVNATLIISALALPDIVIEIEGIAYIE